MPRERKQRGHRHAEKRKLEREEQEAEYLASQERTLLFHDRPMNPFGHLTREEEKYFFEVFDEFKRDSWEDEDAREAVVQNVLAAICSFFCLLCIFLFVPGSGCCVDFLLVITFCLVYCFSSFLSVFMTS